MNNFFVQRSIYTFLASIKALDMYNLNIYHEKDYVKSNITKNLINTKNYTNFVHNLYTLMTQKSLQLTVKQILNNYCSNKKSHIMLKYIQRFEYIYNNYYYTKNYDYKYYLNIQRLAITKLYIINQVNNKHGFYKVLKYLHTCEKHLLYIN